MGQFQTAMNNWISHMMSRPIVLIDIVTPIREDRLAP